MGWNEPAIEPLGESCSNTELFRRLAGAMGFDEPALFDDDETLLAQALGQKVDLDELRRVGWMRVPYPDDGRPWGSGVFPTASGKVELLSERLAAMGQPALPTFVPPREGPHGDTDLVARYPLQLMTPKHHTRFLNSGYSHLPKHGPAEGAPFVELDAADATARGLADGDAARVWNDRASVQLPVRVTERLRPGVAAIPFGWWMAQHPDGRSANSLTNDTLTEWGGGVAFSDTLVEVARAVDRRRAATSSTSSTVRAANSRGCDSEARWSAASSRREAPSAWASARCFDGRTSRSSVVIRLAAGTPSVDAHGRASYRASARPASTMAKESLRDISLSSHGTYGSTSALSTPMTLGTARLRYRR